MALIGFLGDLGAGKTLALTYFAYRSWVKGRTIFSNYNSLKFKDVLIRTIQDLDNMRSGFGALDELWLWADSRLSPSKRNRVSSFIVIKSRKRDLDIGYTTQHWMQIDVRIRNVTDFLVFPELNQNESFCRLKIISYPYMQHVKTILFKTKDFFDLYDTTEEIDPLICTNEMLETIKQRQEEKAGIPKYVDLKI